MLTREQLLSPVDDATWRRLDAYMRGVPTLANIKHQLPALIAAALDGDIRLGDDGWIIPRQTKTGWTAAIQTGYEYILRRMYENGAQKVEAVVVRKGDNIVWNGARCVKHERDPFDDGDDSSIRGAWARVTSASGIEFDGSVGRAELDRLAEPARALVKAGRPPGPWVTHLPAMACKTAILRAAKLSPYHFIDPDDSDRLTADAPTVTTTPAHEFAPITAEEDF